MLLSVMSEKLDRMLENDVHSSMVCVGVCTAPSLEKGHMWLADPRGSISPFRFVGGVSRCVLLPLFFGPICSLPRGGRLRVFLIFLCSIGLES